MLDAAGRCRLLNPLENAGPGEEGGRSHRLAAGSAVIRVAVSTRAVRRSTTRFRHCTSRRGSNPDALLVPRMLDGGRLYIARRVVRMASEEIGNADPRRCPVSERLEGQERPARRAGRSAGDHRSACAPKSNAVTPRSSRHARCCRERSQVPHLRNAPTKLMKELATDEYRYAHDEPDAYAAGEDYFPEAMQPGVTTIRFRAGWKANCAS